jgi:hypothetical protein
MEVELWQNNMGQIWGANGNVLGNTWGTPWKIDGNIMETNQKQKNLTPHTPLPKHMR